MIFSVENVVKSYSTGLHPQGAFSVNEVTGVIFVSGRLDANAAQEINFVVQATDVNCAVNYCPQTVTGRFGCFFLCKYSLDNIWFQFSLFLF